MSGNSHQEDGQKNCEHDDDEEDDAEDDEPLSRDSAASAFGRNLLIGNFVVGAKRLDVAQIGSPEKDGPRDTIVWCSQAGVRERG